MEQIVNKWFRLNISTTADIELKDTIGEIEGHKLCYNVFADINKYLFYTVMLLYKCISICVTGTKSRVYLVWLNSR